MQNSCSRPWVLCTTAIRHLRDQPRSPSRSRDITWLICNQRSQLPVTWAQGLRLKGNVTGDWEFVFLPKYLLFFVIMAWRVHVARSLQFSWFFNIFVDIRWNSLGGRDLPVATVVPTADMWRITQTSQRRSLLSKRHTPKKARVK